MSYYNSKCVWITFCLLRGLEDIRNTLLVDISCVCYLFLKKYILITLEASSTSLIMPDKVPDGKEPIKIHYHTTMSLSCLLNMFDVSDSTHVIFFFNPLKRKTIYLGQ